MKIMIMTKGDLSTILYHNIVNRLREVSSIYIIDTSSINDDLDKFLKLTIPKCDIIFVDGYSYVVASRYYYDENRDRSNIVPILDPDVIVNICIAVFSSKSVRRAVLDYIAELLKFIANNLFDDDSTSKTSK